MPTDDHSTLLLSLERRGLLRGTLSLGAFAMLTGCDVDQSGSVEKTLLAISAISVRMQAWRFNPAHLAPTYSHSTVIRPPRFNANFDIDGLKPVDPATWKLNKSLNWLSGL